MTRINTAININYGAKVPWIQTQDNKHVTSKRQLYDCYTYADIYISCKYYNDISDKIYVVSIPGIISETHGCLLLYDISNGIKPYTLQYVDIDLKLDQLQVFRLT